MIELLPYLSPAEHLDDSLELVRLLLLRHILRHWYRLTDSSGKLNDLFVSLEEARQTLIAGFGQLRPTAFAQMPDLPLVEQEIAEKRISMRSREAISVARLPLLQLARAFSLDPLSVNVLQVLAAVQLELSLHRAATFAWADATTKVPTLGFVAELIADDREALRQAQRLASPLSPLRRFHLTSFQHDDRWGRDTPDLFLRLSLPQRILQHLLDADPEAPTQTHTPTQNPHLADPLLARLLRRYDRPISPEDIGLSDSLTEHVKLLIQPPPLPPPPSSAEPPTPSPAPRKTTKKKPASPPPPPSPPATPPVPPTASPFTQSWIVFTGSAPSEHSDVLRAVMHPEQPLIEVSLESQIVHGRPQVEDFVRWISLGLREAKLVDALPLISLGDLLEQEELRPPLMTALSQTLQNLDMTVCLSARQTIAPLQQLLGAAPVISIPPPSPPMRFTLWRHHLASPITPDTQAFWLIIDDVAHRYTLSPRTIASAAHSAITRATTRAATNPHSGPALLQPDDIFISIRHRIEHQLSLLAEPFSSPLSWNDLVLPDDISGRLQEMIAYGRNERRVNDEWGFAKINAYGRGLTALFSGHPGTGKTLTAAIIARELGCELFRVDLSRIVNKYIGETEKNLAKIFDEAERSRAALLFDEADSLFAKRTGVKSSNDRYANLEVNFLLQRMEHFDGVSILTTNLSNEIDEAFMRRIKFRLHFPIPDEATREKLWQRMIPPQAPIAPDVDWTYLAEAFELAPGHIKNAVLRAAFSAAQRKQTRIEHIDLFDAATVESREMGKLIRD